jgi:pimeloyl-ACP methyl ester carboxylesterase
MSDDAATAVVEFRELGAGPAVVLAPGSCSTGAAWRPVIAHLDDVRTITTSLPGYGSTAERRTDADFSMTPVAETLEEVIGRAEAPVHLVGHSFGGLAALAVALRGLVPLLSLTIFEAPAPGALFGITEKAHLAEFRAMTDAYAAAYRAGQPDAIAQMIDFYGGPGSWASLPEPVRAYAVATTPINLRDWENAYRFTLDDQLSALSELPVSVAVGSRSHPAVVRANALIAQRIPGASFEAIAGAAHFMTATHPAEVAALIMRQITSAAELAPARH